MEWRHRWGEGRAAPLGTGQGERCRRLRCFEREGEGDVILRLGFGLMNFYIGRDQSGLFIRSDGFGFSRIGPSVISRPPTLLGRVYTVHRISSL